MLVLEIAAGIILAMVVVRHWRGLAAGVASVVLAILLALGVWAWWPVTQASVPPAPPSTGDLIDSNGNAEFIGDCFNRNSSNRPFVNGICWHRVGFGKNIINQQPYTDPEAIRQWLKGWEKFDEFDWSNPVADGKRACLDGVPEDANPYPDTKVPKVDIIGMVQDEAFKQFTPERQKILLAAARHMNQEADNPPHQGWNSGWEAEYQKLTAEGMARSK